MFASLVAWRISTIEFRFPFLEWVDSIAQNFGAEMLGAFLTFILLEVIRGSREQKIQEAAEEQRAEDLKALQRSVGKQLQEQMRAFIQAQELHQLRTAKTWEERQAILDSMKATGLLQGGNLRVINLQGANLHMADLRGASLYEAELQGAKMREAKLQGARLDRAKLQGAILSRANLQGARYLTVAQLQLVETLEGVILPDGTPLPTRTFEERVGKLPEAPWREAFEAWAETVETDEDGFIKPADLPPADD